MAICVSFQAQITDSILISLYISRLPHLGKCQFSISILSYSWTIENAHFLIIDEPESHLDTANQIQFARLLARLVNSGVKVLITTHSDYIIKEINNLIMLNSSFEDKEEILEEFGYRADDHLDPGSVRSYIAEKETLIPCEIDEFGMAMSVFDETINSINRAASKIATRKVLEAEGE